MVKSLKKTEEVVGMKTQYSYTIFIMKLERYNKSQKIRSYIPFSINMPSHAHMYSKLEVLNIT
jgi:hypothetical protein